jgi:hypothetical protein
VLTIRFLLELCALAALGWYGSTVSWWLAVLLPLAAAILWGLFASPKARYPAGQVPVEVVVFAGAAGAIAAAGRPSLAIAFAGAALADGAAVRLYA